MRRNSLVRARWRFLPALVVALPASAFAQTPVEVPAPQAVKQTPEERLELAVHNLFDLLAKPDPLYEPFVRFTEKTRLWFVLTSGGGLADAEMSEGKAARVVLAALFGPEAGISSSFATPEVVVDRAFGRAKLAIAVREGAKPPECGTAYIDAVLVPPGPWAKAPDQGVWQFTQITLSFEKLRKCPA